MRARLRHIVRFRSAATERVPFFALPKKGTKERRPPRGALGPLARRVRATPAGAATVHPCTGAAEARSLAPSCGPFGRRRTAARGEPELCGFSPPFGAADAGGISPQGERKGCARAPHARDGDRRAPQAAANPRSGSDRRGTFLWPLSFKRKWPARRQPSGTRRCADDTANVRCFAAQTLRCAQGDNHIQGDNKIQTPQASGGGQKPHASLRGSLASLRARAKTGATGACHEGSATR